MDHLDGSSNEPAPQAWGRAKRFGFRFLLVYFILYAFPFPLNRLPEIEDVVERPVERVWNTSAVWVGRHLFGIQEELPLRFSGSGDRTVDYLKLFITVVVSLALAAIWSLVDRKPRAHDYAARWLVLACSFYLGSFLLIYGFFKVIPSQFRPPDLRRLLQPYGESSPMGLLWTFMGASPAYTIFAGSGEVLGGMLLFFRRTRTLGAAVTIGVMSNVVVLNFCYDVPVKLLSTHLLVMGVAIFLYDGRRMANVFLLNRPVPAAAFRPVLPWRWARVLGRCFGLSLIAWFTYSSFDRAYDGYKTFGAGRPRPPLWGIYDVTSFLVDGDDIPPLLSDERRWRGLVIDRPLAMRFRGIERPGQIAVWHMDGRLESHPIELDIEAHTITFLPEDADDDHDDATATPDTLQYKTLDPEQLALSGSWQGQTVEIRLRKRNATRMLLVERGYHWINETPFNR